MGKPADQVDVKPPTFTEELNLRKEKVLTLKKERGLENQKAQVVLVLDISGSMGTLYKSGAVQKLVERILPLGMAFDDNQEVDFYLFGEKVTKVKENLTIANTPGFIDNKVLPNHMFEPGTEYAPAIKRVVKDFTKTKSGGLLGLGKKTFEQMDLPVYVIYITDGANGDPKEAESALIEASKAGVFFQFIGIGNDRFHFLQKLDTMAGREVDNANFFAVKSLNERTDDELYDLLLTEFPSYIIEARKKGLIK